jgi:hypothetical protein
MNLVDWFLNGGDNPDSAATQSTSNSVFSYAILGVVAILLIAIVFGELEEG